MVWQHTPPCYPTHHIHTTPTNPPHIVTPPIPHPTTSLTAAWRAPGTRVPPSLWMPLRAHPHPHAQSRPSRRRTDGPAPRSWRGRGTILSGDVKGGRSRDRISPGGGEGAGGVDRKGRSPALGFSVLQRGINHKSLRRGMCGASPHHADTPRMRMAASAFGGEWRIGCGQTHDPARPWVRAGGFFYICRMRERSRCGEMRMVDWIGVRCIQHMARSLFVSSPVASRPPPRERGRRGPGRSL